MLIATNSFIFSRLGLGRVFCVVLFFLLKAKIYSCMVQERESEFLAITLVNDVIIIQVFPGL